MYGVLTEKYGLGAAYNESLNRGTEVHQIFSDMLIAHNNKKTIEVDDSKEYKEALLIFENFNVQKLIKLAQSNKDTVESEIRFELAVEDKDGDTHEIGGTVDVLYYHQPSKTLYVYDVKTGVSDVWKAENNSQLTIYAIAAIEHYQILPTTIQLGILQESRKNYDFWDYSIDDLYANYKSIIKRLTSTDYSYNINTHCKYCNAKSHCPQLLTNINYIKKAAHDNKRF